MINNFMKSPQANSLAVIVLIALVITWFTSLVLSLRDVPVATDKGWYARLLAVISLLGIPAALDLLQIQGTAFFFAAIVFVVFVLNIVIPILRMTGKLSNSLIDGWQKWVIGFNADVVVIRDVLGPTSTNWRRPQEYEVSWETFLNAWGAQGFDGLAVEPPTS